MPVHVLLAVLLLAVVLADILYLRLGHVIVLGSVLVF